MTQNSFIKSRWQRLGLTVQEQIVLALTALLLVFFSVILDNFLSTGNMINLLRSVAVLGMLSLGMCLEHWKDLAHDHGSRTRSPPHPEVALVHPHRSNVSALG